MKTILVPTDFSTNAETALHFAIILAKKLNARLILAHVYQLPIALQTAPQNVLADDVAEIKIKAEHGIKVLCMHIQHAEGISYEYILESGNTVEALERILNSKAIDLLVMGTRGNNRLASSIFGSTASQIMSKAHCPVLALPEGVRFDKGIKKMTYATDYRKNDIEAISKLTEIAAVFNSQINVLHISGDEIDAEDEIKLMSEFMTKVNQAVNYNNLSFQILHGNDVEDKLEQYISEGSSDMMVMATHYRNFMDKLFGKSITKEIVLETTIPLLAFHYSKTPDIKIY